MLCEELGKKVNNTKIFMVVWDLNLKFKHKVSKIDIYTPLFSLNQTDNEDKVNWIRLETFHDQLKIDSNFSSLKHFKSCTTYIINPFNNMVVVEYKGFDTFRWIHNEWSWGEEMQIHFDVEMHCADSMDPPIIWLHYKTVIQPPINNNDKLVGLSGSVMDLHTVISDQGTACFVKRNSLLNNYHSIGICPVNTTGDWNLLTVMLSELENNDWEWSFQHTTHFRVCGTYFPTASPVIIVQILELRTTFTTALMDPNTNECRAE